MDTYLDFRYLGNLKVSPNNQGYAFTVAKANLEKNEYHHTLYHGNSEGINKCLSLKTNQQFIYLNHNHLLINYEKTKKETKDLKESFIQSYYDYDLETKTLKKAFTLPMTFQVEDIIDSEVLLLSATLREDAHILYEGTQEQRQTYLKEKKKNDLYEDIDEIPYLYNGAGFINGSKHQLFLYDLKSKNIKRIFDPEFNLETFTISADKKTIYYAGKHPEKVKSSTSKIYAYDIKNDAHETLYQKTDYNIIKLIELDKCLLVIAKDMIVYGLNQNPNFYQIRDEKLEILAPFGQSIGNTVGTDSRFTKSEQSFVKDNIFYFVSTIDDHTEINSIDQHGTLKTVYQMVGAIDGLVLYKDQALIIGMVEQKLQELYAYTFDQQTLKRLTRLNASVLAKSYVSKPRQVIVKNETHDVKGFVLLPKDYDRTKKYPAILNIHGGPKTVYGQIYYHEMQYWANEGYVVFFANPRGSDGKGDAFADIRGKYGTIDYDDLMAFTHQVIKKYPAIDQQRLYVTGGSYGGFMTNWIIGQTHMFKAAVTQRSISNWISFYGTSDIGYFFATDQAGGHPLLDMDKLYQQSPIKNALNIKTPLLFIHSDQDHRCPMEQAQQLYAILKNNGLDTKLIWIKNENHELSRSGKPQARLKRLKEITEWFNNHA